MPRQKSNLPEPGTKVKYFHPHTQTWHDGEVVKVSGDDRVDLMIDVAKEGDRVTTRRGVSQVLWTTDGKHHQDAAFCKPAEESKKADDSPFAPFKKPALTTSSSSTTTKKTEE